MVFLPQFPKEQLLTQLSNGFVLLVLGMGTVFIFLILLVFLTKGLSAFVMKLESNGLPLPPANLQQPLPPPPLRRISPPP